MLRFNQVNGNYVGFGDKTEISEDEKNKFYLPYGEAEETDLMRASLLSLKENVITKKIAYMTVVVSYDDGANISPNEEKTISVKIVNNVKAYGNLPHTAHIELALPEGFTADKESVDVFVPHWTPFTLDCVSEEIKIRIKAGATVRATNEVILKAGERGRYTKGYIPVVFIAG